VAPHERLRLFCALRLPGDVVQEVVRWQHDHLTAGRIVPPENLHLTLAFLGSTPADGVSGIIDALREAAAAARPISLAVSGYRETRSVGMLTLDDGDGNAASLAGDLHERLLALGVYEPEKRPWLPHLTVFRLQARPRSGRFRQKPGLRPGLPDLGRISPSDAALYNSLLRSTGAQYVVLATLALGGS
jgi:RNA 2',3'-cyclic 3'-phosphodiesterase